MPKVQGKQIAYSTIEQQHLSLVTPSSGDTFSGATVQYVNNQIITVSGATGIIGPAPDGTYTDGLFPNFTSGTTIGTAVDDFNQVLLKLAPTPPSNFSVSTFGITSSVYTAKALTSGTVTNAITTAVSPTFSVSFPNPPGVSDPNAGTIAFDVDGSVQETYTIVGATIKLNDVIRFTAGDPYFGISGKANFWSGFTAMNIVSTTSLPPNATQKTAHLIHSTKGSASPTSFYVDDPSAPTVGTVTATVAAYTASNRKISGVPSLASGDAISNIAFNINNAVSYFFVNGYMYQISGGQINAKQASPGTNPTRHGQVVSITSESSTVANGAFNTYSDTSFTFGVLARNAQTTASSAVFFTDSTKRVDTVSNETSRRTSGTGTYPATGYNGAYDSTQDLVSSYTTELQLRNGIYVYPTVDYTAVGGPNYSTASGLRWVTFNVGSFTNNSAVLLTITETNIPNIAANNSHFYFEVKIDGALPSKWVDGDAAYSGVGNPGAIAGSDGVAAVVSGYPSTNVSRRITFGSEVHTGNIIVRIGYDATLINVTVTSITSSAII